MAILEAAGLPVDCITIENIFPMDDGTAALIEFSHPDGVEMPKDLLDRIQAALHKNPEYKDVDVSQPGNVHLDIYFWRELKKNKF